MKKKLKSDSRSDGSQPLKAPDRRNYLTNIVSGKWRFISHIGHYRTNLVHYIQSTSTILSSFHFKLNIHEINNFLNKFLEHNYYLNKNYITLFLVKLHIRNNWLIIKHVTIYTILFSYWFNLLRSSLVPERRYDNW